MNSSVRGVDRRGAREPVDGAGSRPRGTSLVMPRTAERRPRRARSRARAPTGRADAVGSGRTGSAEHEVASFRGPAGRVVREFDERPATDPGRHMEVGQQPDAIGPGVRREPAVPRERELGDGPRPEHAGGQDDVGLVDVEGVGLDRGDELGERPGHLAAGDPDARRGRPQRRQSLQVGAGQRLLDPQDAERGEARRRSRERRPDRASGVVSPAIRQPWLRSTMIAIESPTASRVAATAARPVLELARIDPDLERAEPFVAQTQRRFGAGRRGQEHPARGIGGDPVAGAAEQGRDREPGDLADDVPQGDLERPVAAGVEVDRLERPDVPGDRQGIPADEQVLVGLEAVHRVARADPDDPLVGLDPDDGRRERAPRDGVPGRREGGSSGTASRSSRMPVMRTCGVSLSRNVAVR